MKQDYLIKRDLISCKKLKIKLCWKVVWRKSLKSLMTIFLFLGNFNRIRGFRCSNKAGNTYSKQSTMDMFHISFFFVGHPDSCTRLADTSSMIDIEKEGIFFYILLGYLPVIVAVLWTSISYFKTIGSMIILGCSTYQHEQYLYSSKLNLYFVHLSLLYW